MTYWNVYSTFVNIVLIDENQPNKFFGSRPKRTPPMLQVISSWRGYSQAPFREIIFLRFEISSEEQYLDVRYNIV